MRRRRATFTQNIRVCDILIFRVDKGRDEGRVGKLRKRYGSLNPEL